jgi:hypothetical protein
MMLRRILTALLAFIGCGAAQDPGRTVVGIRGSQFTINGQISYTSASGFPGADSNLAGTLLNVRAVQAIFDDANYPNQGSRLHPYDSNTLGPIFWDYPGGAWDPERNVREFLAALPDWRRSGLLAFTVNLQGGGPPDGNYGERVSLQPHNNSGFDLEGHLKPAYAGRLRRVIAEADRLGMVAIVGFFYFGQNERIQTALDDRYVRQAILEGCRFLKDLPHRNILIEINNETSTAGYKHHILQPDGALDAVLLAQETVGRQIPVSMSWSGGIMPRGSRGEAAMRAVDYVMFHTNGQTPEQVHQSIQAMRRWLGYSRPVMINEDGVSTFNLHAAVQEHAGWGYYDNGLDNYRDGFQAPPVNWRINTPLKWLFFEQVARLTGSPIPPKPDYSADDSPVIDVIGLKPGQVLRERAWIEALIQDRHPRWPIKRVEFFIDGVPYSYSRTAPFWLNNQEWWDMADVTAGQHVLRVVAYDQRGPRFAEICSMVEIPFSVEKGR